MCRCSTNSSIILLLKDFCLHGAFFFSKKMICFFFIACQCYNHSESCTYNATKGYGVCDNCTDNTYGDHCQLCQRSFYRNSAVLMTDSNACLACACHIPGVISSADSSTCDNATGQCSCKTLVTGRACDTCVDTHWNLSPSNEAGCEVNNETT
ncbi:PREDICTED: netrin-3-like [Acropora digitifera]|uniref:netrin-3-like n=1 Tax=Acropora digitifera TaxID=70779 RepID=UPI00077B06C2|nr:PREDICTED: netrin-3-like [Acropora digitifera]